MKSRVFIAYAALLSLLIPPCVTAQSCCPAGPTSETSQSDGPNVAYPTTSQFYQFLQGGSGHYTSWVVTELEGAAGSDSCYTPLTDPAFVPEYPSVNGSSWTVGRYNDWGEDSVGFLPGSVDYIRNNSPLRSSTPKAYNFPCGFQLNQNLFVRCPADTTLGENFNNDVLTATIYIDHLQNCREGICNVINR